MEPGDLYYVDPGPGINVWADEFTKEGRFVTGGHLGYILPGEPVIILGRVAWSLYYQYANVLTKFGPGWVKTDRLDRW